MDRVENYMAIYSITYDLKKDKDYEKLFSGIRSLSPSHTCPTRSQWLISSPLTTEQIRDFLITCIDGDDVLLVMKIDMPVWNAWNIPQSSVNWLLANNR